MKKIKWIGIIVGIVLSLVFFLTLKQKSSKITYVIICEDQEVQQEEFLPDEEKGLVARFVLPETLVEKEDIKIRITKIIPQENFCAKLEVVVENNLEEAVLFYSTTQVDEGKEYTQKVIAHKKPIYRKDCIEEVYKNEKKIEEKRISNPENYEAYYFRKREDFTKSMNYKYKQVFDLDIYYPDKKMNPEELNISLQISYSDKNESIIQTKNLINLFTNEEIIKRKESPKEFAEVTSFNDVNQDIIEIGNKQYILERNQLLIKNTETQEEEIIYQPIKRGHYIMKYFVGETSIYFLEEIPGEEINNPNIYKKYCRLCIMNRDGTDAVSVLDDIECDWFYIPSLYVYENTLYLYDWDFLKGYKLDQYGRPEEVILKEGSIFSNDFSDSLLIYNPETEKNDFYGLPFWLKKYGYRIVSSDSGEVMIDKSGEWETLFYLEDTTGEKGGFYGTNLEVIAENHLVFRVSKIDDFDEAYIYNLEEEKVEGILTLPNGKKNCQGISADNEGIYFKKRVQTPSNKDQIYYYEFATKKVEKYRK